MAYVVNVGTDHLGARGGLLDASGYLLSGSALFFHRRGEGGGNLIDAANFDSKGCDCIDGEARGQLNFRNLATNLVSCFGSLAGEAFYFVCHYCEAFAGVAGARSLNSRIQCQ